MNADNFIAALNSGAPSLEQLVAAGLSRSEAERISAGSRATPRSSAPRYVDPLLDLIERYDVANLEIGHIRFAEMPSQEGQLTVIGDVDGDPLVIDGHTREVVVMGAEGEDKIAYRCAKDSMSFLDAILQAALFLNRRAFDDALYADDAYSIRNARECAAAAGGTNYEAFYRMLHGV